VKLPAPNQEEVAAAKAAVEELIGNERAMHEKVRQSAPPPTWEDIRTVWTWRIKSLFFARTDSGELSNRPLVLPMLAVGLFVFGGGMFFLRWLRKRN
jgi:hypothetical protein